MKAAHKPPAAFSRRASPDTPAPSPPLSRASPKIRSPCDHKSELSVECRDGRPGLAHPSPHLEPSPGDARRALSGRRRLDAGAEGLSLTPWRNLYTSFDSGSEEPFDREALHLADARVRFLDSSHARLDAACAAWAIPIVSLIRKLRRKKPAKSYFCDFCATAFTSASAKGGHISKVHSGQSEKFQQRVYASRVHTQEQRRTKYLNAIRSTPNSK